MGKLIEVEKFKKDLLENYAFSGFPDLLKDFCAALDSQPSVDAVPVRHGRWKWNGEAFICSACGNGHKGQPTIMGQPMFEFCPICGARMDGKDGGND